MILRFRRLINKKSLIVFVITGLLFHMLFRARSNPDALQAGTPAPDIALESVDGQKFRLSELDEPVMLAFFNTHTFLSGGLYTKYYLNRMPYLKGIEDAGRAKLVVVLDTEQTKNIINKETSSGKYKVLEKRVYLGNIEQAEKDYGISIWPHFFLIDKEHTIIYEAKVPSVELVDDLLDRSR
ncbi:MAG: peroxiredoxin family protein [Deferribacterales bacterium]